MYAHVYIRINLANKLSVGVWIDGVNGRFFQKVEYEGIPLLCLNCGMIGHKSESYLHAPPHPSGKNVTQPRTCDGLDSSQARPKLGKDTPQATTR